MSLRPEQFERDLAQGLRPLYTLTGDTWLLIEEARDAIRARARQDGVAERVRFDVEQGFDWSALRNVGRNLSLFADRRLIDVRIPNGKPGKEGAQVLRDLAAESGDSDDIVIVSLPRLDRATQQSAWFKALADQGVAVTFWPIGLRDLPGWIANRARQLGLELMPDAAGLIAERVEGNLLAARQELEKLALSGLSGKITVETLLQSISDQSRYETFDLGDALLAGDISRALHLLARLQEEGVDAILVLWVLTREMRLLAATAASDDAVLGKARIPQHRRSLYQRAARRGSGRFWAGLLGRCADVDRAIKGVLPRDPWQEMGWILVSGCEGLRSRRA